MWKGERESSQSLTNQVHPSLSDDYNVVPAYVLAEGTRMPTAKAYWALRQELDRYKADCEARELSPATVKGYMCALRDAFRRLYEAGREINPRRIGQAEIDFLKASLSKREDGTPNLHNYAVEVLIRLKGFLKWAGNKQVDKLNWPKRRDERPKAGWLEPHEANLLMEKAVGLERILVHCELGLAMRRVEVLRLTVSDFRGGRSRVVYVLGKGKNGGKLRDVPWDGDTATELEYYLAIRNSQIAKAKAKNPNVVVPDNLLIYEAGGELRPYKRSALDKCIKHLGKRLGLKFSHHTLRRTWGRNAYLGGGQIGRIRAIYGHEEESQTWRYIGLTPDDLADLMRNTTLYVKSVKIPEKGISGDSQENGGPCGITDHEDDWLVVQNSNPRYLPGSLR